jgi:hypothetical protein
MQVLELALHLPVLELMALLQLHEQLVVIEQRLALQTQLLESMAEQEPVPPEDLHFLRT